MLLSMKEMWGVENSYLLGDLKIVYDYCSFSMVQKVGATVPTEFILVFSSTTNQFLDIIYHSPLL